MDHAHILLTRLWEPFNLLVLFLYTSAGTVLAALAGLILVIALQRGGWLARRNRWHHGVLKLYFLALPLCGGFLGFQAGSLYGSQQQIYRHMDSYAPLLQTYANSVHEDLQSHLAEQDLAALEARFKGQSVQQVLAGLALDYLRQVRAADAEQLVEASWAERLALNLFDHVRASLIGRLAGEKLVGEAAHYSWLDKRVLSQMLDARFEQLFEADFLLGLMRQQIGRLFRPLYMALLIQFGVLLSLLGLELLVSRRLSQTLAAASSSAVLSEA